MEISQSLDYDVVNIVSLWDIGKLTVIIDNTRRKKRYNAQVIRKGGGVFLVFASGKVVATGFKSVALPGSLLQEIYPEKDVIFKRVINITAHSFLPYGFNTTALIERYQDTTYEPEIYPAVYIRLHDVTLIYYTTGSIIVTGAKEKHHIDLALSEFCSRTASIKV
ncbi:TATA box-binding protein-like protein 1 [Tetranychus urticae]|uniref:TATA box-binding protein-like protein 1 n=1 Tax=Tetranychus urticae TaxID=32264 RepID=UPI00077C0C17|nr:TATA box-binding protein-like protein 1 [Tetranychus urticae]